MASWLKMLKDLTVRSHVKEVRTPPPMPSDEDWVKPLSYLRIKELLSASTDIVFREFILKGKQDIQCSLAVVDGLIDKQIIDQFILKPLMVDFAGELEKMDLTQKTAPDLILSRLAPANEIKKIDKLGDALDGILSGDAVLFLGEESALLIGARGWVNRGVAEPQTESSVRGPREGLSETLRINTSLIRRKIKHPSLRIKSLKVGELTRTDIVVTYIESLASEDVLNELYDRLSRIKIDGVLESGYLEELIEDMPYSPFPQVTYTERPDVVAANLLEGKIAILVDGTPIALIVPVVFAEFMQVSEDYFERAMIVILVRFVRFAGVFLALLAPSIYIAVTNFHHEMLPTDLALSIAAGRENVPVPALLEALIMVFALEILQEAGLRLPRPMGQTIGIVGALIIGDAAVKANLVSPIMVIIVGLTAVATYAMPSYDVAIAIRLVRVPLMILAGSLGFFGIGVGLYALLIHLLCLRSFGTPYLSPIAPLRIRALLQDTFVRAPWWALKRRPHLIETKEPKTGGNS
ncbi:MAG: spore germination protein [Desulfitobacterium hafniense]|nr:spore germination protein [Desulfitobacterium hafniense]